MDRPYLRGTRGIHKNVEGGVRNYGKLEDIGFERLTEDEENVFLNENFKN
jgi:hypothetical protein